MTALMRNWYINATYVFAINSDAVPALQPGHKY